MNTFRVWVGAKVLYMGVETGGPQGGPQGPGPPYFAAGSGK